MWPFLVKRVELSWQYFSTHVYVQHNKLMVFFPSGLLKTNGVGREGFFILLLILFYFCNWSSHAIDKNLDKMSIDNDDSYNLISTRQNFSDDNSRKSV